MQKTKNHAKLIKRLRKKLTSKEFINKHKTTEKAFTRDRLLTFQTVFIFLINFITKSLQSELDNLFKIILHSELPENKVSKGAFSQARQKLKHEAFIDLDKDQIEYFYDSSDYKKWNGFRLIAIDGSTSS